jgi:soluble lytic murein transglycosylase-like protein
MRLFRHPMLWLCALALSLLGPGAEARGPARDLTKFKPSYKGAAAKVPPPSRRALAAAAKNGFGGVDQILQGHCEAARKGDKEAQFRLGWIYANGNGVARDDGLAAAWFQQAARAGDTQSERLLKAMGGAAGVKRQATCGFAGGGRPSRPLRVQPARGPVVELVRSLAPEYQLDPELVLALIEVESNFNPQARSPKDAQGLMQLIPATAERFGVKDVWDPEDNLRGGMAYLRWLLKRFDGDVKLTLAAYNAGEGAVDRHGGVPPYSETRAYVSRISDKLDL